MDVIGDVETAVIRGAEEISRVRKQATKGRNIGTVAWVLLLLSLPLSFVAALQAMDLQHAHVGQWTWYGPAGVLVAVLTVMFALLTRSYFHLWESHCEKDRLLRYLQDADQQARNDVLKHSRFLAVFRPPQSDIDRALTLAAFDVLKAHEQQVKFFVQGAGDYGKERVHADPEDEAHRLRVAIDAQKEQLSLDVSRALHDFRYPRDLAKALEYKVCDSWKDYIPECVLPRQLKKGRSEQPDLLDYSAGAAY